MTALDVAERIPEQLPQPATAKLSTAIAGNLKELRAPGNQADPEFLEDRELFLLRSSPQE